MAFLDIFSKTPEKEDKEELSRIIVDNHEKNSLVPASLSSLHVPFEFQDLKVGDYLINDIAIERKTFQDLQSSIINKRIFQQLQELKQYPQHLLLIEGEFSEEDKIIHENASRGFILSTLLNNQVPILFTKNEKDTASYLYLLAKKKSSSPPALRPSKIAMSEKEQIQFILEGFPNIGPASIKKLLEKYKSLKDIINAPEQDLVSILGKKGEALYSLINLKLS